MRSILACAVAALLIASLVGCDSGDCCRHRRNDRDGSGYHPGSHRSNGVLHPGANRTGATAK